MSPASIIRRYSADLFRWSRAGRGSVRPSLYPADPAKPGSPSASSCRATQAALPPPRNSAIAAPATSSAAASPTAASKSP
jgi:hypothetical protein